MQSQIITDDQITSSSSLDDTTLPHFARLLNDKHWTPHPEDDAPWLQISFDEQMILSGLVVEGIKSLELGWIWLDEFYLMYSNDLIQWTPYVYFEHGEKVLSFNFT